jgi:hypothetical protein
MTRNTARRDDRSHAELTIEELETGLRQLRGQGVDVDSFWEKHIHSFRRTVIFAIRETSDALLSPTIPSHWRIELESDLEDLVQYMALADRYIARSTTNAELEAARLAELPHRIH